MKLGKSLLDSLTAAFEKGLRNVLMGCVIHITVVVKPKEKQNIDSDKSRDQPPRGY